MPHRLASLFALVLCCLPALAADDPKPDPAREPLPEWLWTYGGEVEKNQAIMFRKVFDLDMPPDQKPASALLWAAGDDEVRVFCNGKAIGSSNEVKEPIVASIKQLLVPGRNVIAIAVRNIDKEGGMVAKATIVMGDGKRIEIVSDKSWKSSRLAPPGWDVARFNDRDWPSVHSFGKYGMQPWGQLPAFQPPQATPAETLQPMAGFKVELLYSVPKATQGSWVCLTSDPRGRLIVSDQFGSLHRVTVGARPEDTQVEEIPGPLGHAQGLLHEKDALYVVVNGGFPGAPSGLYRLRDTNGDDKYDRAEPLLKIPGEGEHGPHAIRRGPDGKLYVIAGNFTKLPAGLSASSPHRNYAEDLLLPRITDTHDPNVWAPGGWIVRGDPDKKDWELVCAGMRNAYDFDFSPHGEIFTYDSDMELDVGMSWYRPNRALMLCSGGDYGFRNGSGKWPDYHADSLGAVVNTGLSSPTGVCFGFGAKFPAKYQRAFLVQDWAYGMLYAVHLMPEGAGYKGSFETLLSGKGLALTDMVVHSDGHLYFTTGGRRTQSGLYRLSYVGNEPTTPVSALDDPAAAEARKLRHALEAFHSKQDPAAIDFAWEHLGSPDRHIRYAARVAVEHQPLDAWREKALAETRPHASVQALIALIRATSFVPDDAKKPVTGPLNPETARAMQPKVLQALGRLNLKSISEEQLVEALRAYQLCVIRLGRPDDATSLALAERLAAVLPHASPVVNRELATLMVYLKHPKVVEKCLAQLAASKVQEDQFHYAMVLRLVDQGWTLDQRKAYFSFLAHAEQNYKGGSNLPRFVQRMRQDAEKTLSEADRTALDPFLKGLQKVAVVQAGPPRQFVRNWQMADLAPELDKTARGRNFASGKAAFEAAQCATCHKFGDTGGATGPDLTGVGNRFNANDILESILLPSKVISDQFADTEFKARGDLIAGRIEAEDDEKVVVRTHPLTAETVTILKKDIKFRRLSKLSTMPEGLVDILKQEEILDLVAYLRAGGNEKDAAFGK